MMWWELAERLTGSLPGVCREIAERIKSLPGVLPEACRRYHKLLGVPGSLSNVIGSLSGWHREFAERRPRDLPEDRRGLSKACQELIMDASGSQGRRLGSGRRPS
ncbi:hypothetical protein BHM03_00037632 [Ensete ventricosum]|nr:hypothetical protein BHM03_00037632 [Ensete ventricosum]